MPDIDLQSLYAGKRVAVAGVTGFLGINCALALRALGANVVGIARRRSALSEPACHELMEVDLGVRGAAASAIQGASIVFDCLGYPGLAPSDLDPGNNLEAEFRPHLNLFLECAKQPDPVLVVQVSSRLVYGTPATLPVDEMHALNPGNLYAAHKVLVENYARVLARTHGLRSVIFRLSSPYGPNGPGTPGRLGVWNQFIQKAMLGETLTIYGEGNQLRDFIYIDDVTRVLLMAAVTPACAGEVFNLGGEQAISLRDAVATIAREAGGTPVEHVPWPVTARLVETGDYRSDIAKIRRFVPVLPQISFDEGVRRTIAAMRSLHLDHQVRPRLAPATPLPTQTAPAALTVDGLFQGQRALVVGASGFVGGHLIRRMLAEGATVSALSRTAGPLQRLITSGACDFAACDLMDADALHAAVRTANPDIVLFAASVPDGEESKSLIRDRIEVNTIGLLNLLEACRAHVPAARIVYGDSRKVYGNAPVPHRSTTEQIPISSYASSKGMGWSLCQLYNRIHGTVLVSVRPSLIYGPGQGYNLVRMVIEAVRRGDKTIRLKGGGQTRDPLFIDDAVDAFVAAALRAEALAGRALVIGGREELPVHELVKQILDVCGSTANVVSDPDTMRPTDSLRSVCDLSEAAHLIDWSPRVSLRRGLELTVQADLPELICEPDRNVA